MYDLSVWEVGLGVVVAAAAFAALTALRRYVRPDRRRAGDESEDG